MKEYTPFLTIFLIIVIVGFSAYKETTTVDEKEGLENMENDVIQRDDGVTVRRRKKSKKVSFDPVIENYKEGLKIPGLSAITNGVKKIPKSFTKIGKSVSSGFMKTLNMIGKFFKYVGAVFTALFSYVECGFYKVIKLPQCMGWYLLEIFGHILYIPFGFFFWVFSLQSIEKKIWRVLEDIDCFCHASTGYHLIHYSDSIVNKCYKCKIKKIPKFPKI